MPDYGRMKTMKVYKRPPFDFYDAVAMESWLSDLAKQGLFLEGTSFFWFFRFTKGEPSDVRYRVEPVINENQEPTEEIMESYQEAGWDFVDGLNNLFFIWKSTRADAAELHSDPIVQSEGYHRLCKKLRQSVVFTSLSVLAIYALTFIMFFIINRPVTHFIENPAYFFLLVFYIYMLVEAVRQARSAGRVKKMLADGLALSHQKDYRKDYRIYRFINRLISVSLLLIIAISLLSLRLDWRKNTVDVDYSLPYLPLDLIEQSEVFTWAEPDLIFDTDIDYNNYVDYSWTPLAPEHYKIRQEGAEEPHKWPDGSGYYKPRATTEYYRLSFSFFSPHLFNELMDQYLWDYEEYTISEPDAFDRTVIALDRKHSMSHLFVHYGKQVIYIRYQGYADLSERIHLLAQILNNY